MLPTEGEILVDGVNINKLKLNQLRKNIGLATQDVLLYSDTIDGNIAYGDSNISKDEVVRFAKYSAASEKIFILLQFLLHKFQKLYKCLHAQQIRHTCF